MNQQQTLDDQLKEFSKEHKVDERFWWETGCLRYILKPDLQRRVYDFIHGWKEAHANSAKPIVINLHRAAGKTFLLALLGIERCIKYPDQQVRFGAECVSQADRIVEPNIQKILDHMPKGFVWDRREEKSQPYYLFRNPTWPKGSRDSKFWLIGCRERANTHRGERSHAILLDECRDIDNFEYIAKVVFGPHFATMSNPLYIMSSTPPESMDHPWSRLYLPDAEFDGRYIECNVSENKDWTKDDDERMLELFHSKESTDWRREMKCERISDPQRMIVPEFDEKLHVQGVHDRPDHYIPIITADGGFIDFFACLYGYVDFNIQKLVVEDSIVVRRYNTGQLSDSIKEKQIKLYGKKNRDNGVEYDIKPRRYADMTPQQLADFEQIYKLYFEPTDKTDPDAKIATLRDRFFKNQIIILKNNTALISQLKNAIRDENGKLTRSEEHGHWDAVMALAYMADKAPWHVNPGFVTPEADWTRQQIPRKFTPKLFRLNHRRGAFASSLRRRIR